MSSSEHPKKEKIRLDNYLTTHNLAQSRQRAQALIMSGIVYVNNEKQDKPGTQISSEATVEVRGQDMPFVSRGGLKLDKAIKAFNIELNNKICMDIGASTGGFTDCMLQNGAQKVYAVDVGYGQLAWKLRCDERVVNMERTNIRAVTREQVIEELDFFSVDVSFISLKHIFPVAAQLAKENATCVCLIKPQFEAGKEKVGKKGVVREKSTHIETIQNACNFANLSGFSVLSIDFSPIRGPEGNIEFLLYAQKSSEITAAGNEEINNVVSAAHSSF